MIKATGAGLPGLRLIVKSVREGGFLQVENDWGNRGWPTRAEVYYWFISSMYSGWGTVLLSGEKEYSQCPSSMLSKQILPWAGNPAMKNKSSKRIVDM